MNQVSKVCDLGAVVMPLIRVMGATGLSWANREEIATVIRECCRHHKSMMDEAQMHQQAQAGMQMAQKLAGTGAGGIA